MAPAGPVDEQTIETALARCHRLGLEPVPGGAVRARHRYLAGPDADRAADLTAAIAGDAAAIWALRGGYGTLRTLDHVELTPLARRPKAFIGFSDNTVVHLALHRLGVVSFHGPHAGYRHFPPPVEAAFRAVLMEDRPAGAPPQGHRTPHALVAGTAEGPLVGGDLALLGAVCGTPYQPDARGAILFIEDVDEPAYRVDRLLTQLRLAGVLDGIAGVAVGDLTPPRDGEESEAEVRDVVREILEPLGVPVVAGLPIGHGTENWTIPLGVRARLDAGAGLDILQPATTTGGTAT